MRVLLIVFCAMLLFYALRAVARWLLQSRPRRDAGGADGEMVLDAECGVYVLKERAVSRRSRATTLYFCSERCAALHDARRGG